jgi:hypothetical protein
MAEEHAAFIARYHEVVDELDRTGRNDPETMWLLGSLVARLVTKTDAQNWTQLKLILDNASLKELVETLNTNADTYEAEGKTKAAYVARLLGISLVASKIMEPKTRQRDQLLSHFIDTAAYVFITNHEKYAAAKG